MRLIDRIRRRLRPRSAPVRTDPPRRPRGVDPRDQLHEYWRNPGGPNDPERYLEPIERSQFLMDVVRPYLSPDAPILEIGCNVGRNLAHVFDAGCRELTGIDINADAIALLRSTFPELGSTATLIVAPVEDVIKDLPDGGFDLVYTMAVLEHIHPDSEWIFGEMVRITRSILVTVEDEHGVSAHHTPRDYEAIFSALGARQVAERRASEADGLSSDFVARVFEAPATIGSRDG